MSIFDSCSDSCGWAAALLAALTYGSFGVPVRATAHIQVHPLVMQSYKTTVLFLASWLVLWMGEKARWTPWGLLSGLLWVSGGTCGIYAIRSAGLSVAVGVWASVMVVVNFTWGILIFSEPVRNIAGAVSAFLLLGLGLVGMSRYSAPSMNEKTDTDRDKDLLDQEYQLAEAPDGEQRDEGGEGPSSFKILSDTDSQNSDATQTFVIFGRSFILTTRQLGIVGAVGNGILTGSSLVPVHYAKENGFGGAAYMISFATGSLLANCLFWSVFFLFRLYNVGGLVTPAYHAMPLWHVKELWLPGFIAGTLLAIAMFCSILAVTYLGQGVGNSIVQSKILISGLWGIFVFHEIRARNAIVMWFISATIAIAGILWMSYERERAVLDGEI